jgi:hypothetical protein
VGSSCLAIFLAASAVILSAPRVPADDCTPHTIKTELSEADTALSVFLGRGYGEVVLARDTLVRSVSFFRTARPETVAVPLHFFITNVDSTGRPIAWQILQDGPVLVERFGDGVNPVRYRFSFDPPVALPRPDRYFFVVREELCAGSMNLLADSSNSYPDGQLWKTIPFVDCSGLGAVSGTRFPTWDLIFEVEFCDTSGTPTRRTTWGQVKSSYR